MQAVWVNAPAKVNLALDITGVTDNGYHQMEMVMQAVSLYDRVLLEQTKTGGIALSCDPPSLPCDEGNIAWKAAQCFFDACGIQERNVRIHLEKQIPQQAGMGGGSADGAGVLAGLNVLYGTGLSTAQLCRIGIQVGADLPFCLCGGTALVRGIGEQITPLPDLPDCTFVIAKPKGGISTQRAFAEYDRAGLGPVLRLDEMIGAMERGDLSGVCGQLYNALERVCGLRDVEVIKTTLLSLGAKGALMTGSGSAVFGIFTDRGRAYDCERRLKERYPECFVCRPVPHGPMIEPA